jgi:hypothetical protein
VELDHEAFFRFFLYNHVAFEYQTENGIAKLLRVVQEQVIVLFISSIKIKQYII